MTDKVPVKKKLGRPKKADIAKRKKPGTLGRPVGDAGAIKEYKARLLASPKSRKVIDSIMNAALDDNHKSQSAAWKLVIDRIMPLSYFEEAKSGGGKAAVNITITGVGGETTIIGEQEDDIDGDFINLNPNDETEQGE